MNRTMGARRTRLPLREMERLCQKPDHRRLGTWMARRIARPAALRVTWLVAPWGVTANMATLAAWAAAFGAAACLAWGSALGWLLAAVMLQLWYLLDHVDGQLARLRGTASLDGVQLDYLMHHTVNLLVPAGAGFGMFAATAKTEWLFAGFAWGVGLLLVTLHHDARYKAFVERLKRVRGRLEVLGGGPYRDETPPRVPRGPLRLPAWIARKSCEMHVAMNVIAVIALLQWLPGGGGFFAARAYLAAMAAAAPAVAVWSLARSQHRQWAEQEFAAWYQPGEGRELVFRDGWWLVEDAGACPESQGGASSAASPCRAGQFS